MTSFSIISFSPLTIAFSLHNNVHNVQNAVIVSSHLPKKVEKKLFQEGNKKREEAAIIVIIIESKKSFFAEIS